MDNNLQLLMRVKEGNPDVERELVEKNMGLVHTMARRFLYSGVEFEDLFQIGSLGLLKAIRNFDISRGVMFSTYAVPVIVGEIRKYLRDDGVLKISRNIRENYVKIQRINQRLLQTLQREATISELACEAELDIEDVVLALEIGGKPLSLDEKLGSDTELTLADTISIDNSISDLEMLSLKEGISRLDGKDRQLITLRYFLSKTQHQVAEIMGMTQVQVSRREKKILEMIKLSLL